MSRSVKDWFGKRKHLTATLFTIKPLLSFSWQHNQLLLHAHMMTESVSLSPPQWQPSFSTNQPIAPHKSRLDSYILLSQNGLPSSTFKKYYTTSSFSKWLANTSQLLALLQQRRHYSCCCCSKQHYILLLLRTWHFYK